MTTLIEVINHGPIRELRLARPPVNALDTELCRQLIHAIELAMAEDAHGIVLSGSERVFTGGMDVPHLLSHGDDKHKLLDTWNAFFGAVRTLAESRIPVVAAITGHAPAGGAVLAIMCDYRVMARGAYRIGLNEVQVGLCVPEAIQAALRRLVGCYRAERLMVAGAMPESAQAEAIGLVDELVDTDFVVSRAIAWLGDVLKLPQQAMTQTRRLARADLAAIFADPAALPVEDFLDGWFAPEAQQVLHALVARLKSKA